MTKVLIMPKSCEMIFDMLSDIDGIILGIHGLSVNVPLTVSLEEMKILLEIKKQGKKIFVMLNKNMHNQDLEDLKKALQTLEHYQIDGIFYYDISVVQLKETLGISTPLIWSQEHLTTNAGTCNFWKNFGCTGAYLSNEITLEEIKEIRENTTMELFLNIFGFLPMFDSKRHLVKNYLNCFSLPIKGDCYYIEKEGKIYPIIDDELGTTVYSCYILNALPEYLQFQKIGIDYVILNSFHIDNKVFQKIVQRLQNLTEENKDSIFEQVNELLEAPIDKGFLYKETVYKIKGETK